MASTLDKTREELRELLQEYSKVEHFEKSEEQTFRDEAEYAASGLKSSDIAGRIKAVEFLEILGDNPYAQDYLLNAIKDKEGSVVQKAIQALGKVAQRKSISALQDFVKTTTSKHLAAEITRIIGKIERKPV